MTAAPSLAGPDLRDAKATVASRREQALWLLEQMLPGHPINNLNVSFRVAGRLDVAALQTAFDVLVARHAALRTVFVATGDQLQRRRLGTARLPVEVVECEPTQVDDTMAALVRRPFFTDGSALVRCTVVRTSHEDAVTIAAHHLVFDTVSGTTLRDELVHAYDALVEGHGVPAELTTVRAEPGDLSPSAEGVRYWLDHLDGFDPTALALHVGADVADPTLRGDDVRLQLSDAAVAATRQLARTLRAPEAVVLLAAYYFLLARHGAGPDIAVGAPVNVRTRADEGTIGYHVNVLPLRCRVDLDDDFVALVRAARTTFMSGMGRAAVPVEELIERLPRTTRWHNPLFRHAFNYVPGSGLAEFGIGGHTATPVAVENGYSKFDLEFFVLSTADGIGVRAGFCVEVFEPEQVAAILARYDELLVRLGAAPDTALGEVDIFSGADRAVIAAANRAERPVPVHDLLTVIREHATQRPDSVAVVEADGDVTYAQLVARADAIAARLHRAGVGRDDVVALLAPRGTDLAAAVLGCWTVGAAYLPLDPSHPADRLRYQLADSGAALLLSDAAPDGAQLPVLALRVEGGAEQDVTAPAQFPGVASLGSRAYLIYTSGSTGKPKGTAITHHSLANLVGAMADLLEADARDGMVWLTTFSFDISALELFLPLATGGRVLPARDAARTDGTALAEVVARGASIVQATPTTWRLVLPDVGDTLAPCRILCGGEPLPADLAQRLLGTGRGVWNGYGPTEATIYSTVAQVAGDEPVHIGRAIANTTAFITDDAGRELPVGVLGELRLGGFGVAAGYHGRPELTAQRFVDHTRYGRSYRTGDLARWRPDGNVELLGRNDRQIKLRGQRIELGEVETLLQRHTDATVAVVVTDDVEPFIVAFVRGRQDDDLRSRLLAAAQDALPPAAVPASIEFVEAFPLTGNDKIDNRTLTQWATERLGAATQLPTGSASSAGTDAVVVLVELWRELLEDPTLGADSHFFDNGGHSLRALQLTQRIEQRLGTRLRLADVFAAPTPTTLADKVR